MSIRTRQAPGRIVAIPNTDWKTYTRLVYAFAERPGVRMAYDRGVLEIMSPLLKHDRPTDFLGLLVRVLTEELGLPIMGGGSTTLRRKRKQRGIEPDRCYWIANEPAVREIVELDLRIHPPPDLAIEVDVASSSLNRMGIYAALGVPELWRLEGSDLAFHRLDLKKKRYKAIARSVNFPQVIPTDLVRFLKMVGRQEQNAIVRQFRAWVRQLPPATQSNP
ncbi:MAG TPA: Uma2 family endonuclease [Gemmataceae bacterium]|nr:Uma2 family endonuclease [Gemmataceae bacterium]